MLTREREPAESGSDSRRRDVSRGGYAAEAAESARKGGYEVYRLCHFETTRATSESEASGC